MIPQRNLQKGGVRLSLIPFRPAPETKGNGFLGAMSRATLAALSHWFQDAKSMSHVSCLRKPLPLQTSSAPLRFASPLQGGWLSKLAACLCRMVAQHPAI